MNEVLDIIKEFINENSNIENIKTLKTLLLVAVNGITILLSYFGTSFPNIFKSLVDWRNRKSIKGVILNKINDETLGNFGKKLAVVSIEMLWLIFGSILIIIFMHLAILFLSIRSGDISQEKGICIILGILFGTIILSNGRD